MRKHLPPKDHFIGMTFPFLPNHKVSDHIGSGANGRLYRAQADHIDSVLALKVVPTENLPTEAQQRQLYLAEAKKPNALEHPSVVQYYDVQPWDDPKLGRTFVVFICQYVDGLTLNTYIRKRRADISVTFVEQFLDTIFGLLYELSRRGMVHGDLHGGNVMVSHSSFDLTGQTRFRVTDFGIAEITGASDTSDFLFVARILRDLLQCIDYQEQHARDRFVFDVLRNDFLKRHLIETDPLVDALASNPEKLKKKLDSVDQMFADAAAGHTAGELTTPFDYPNCEQIGNAHLLLRSLYSNRLLGLSEIQSRSNLVLTGPRGCGKTTVFRALSLDYGTSIDSDKPSELRFIGIYYRCDDLYFSFPRYDIPSRVEALDIPMHFVVVSLLAETLRHLRRWAMRHCRQQFERHEEAVARDLREALGLRPAHDAASTGFRGLTAVLAKQRGRAAKKHRFCNVPEEPIRDYVGPDALFRCCTILQARLAFLRGKPFYYFIDDYSTPKISAPLQRNLNRLFMHRHADVFFKLSTESPISFERRDVDDKEYVEEREYELLNLGLRYLKDDGRKVRAFLQDLFARRFRAVEGCSYSSLNDLLGDQPRNENEQAPISGT